jgi:glycosyltransferase involved in cell wall biosynthesis
LDRLNVTVAHSGSAPREEDLDFQRVQVPSFDIGGIWYQTGVNKLAADADVVITPLNVRALSNVWLATVSQPSRLIYWGHGLGQSRWANLVRAWMVRRASAAVFYSGEGREAFESFDIPSGKLFVAPNTQHVPNAGFDPTIERRSFLFVGRLQRRKRIDLLLRSFAEARDEIPDEVGVEIVGEGDVGQELKQLTRDLDIDHRTTFWGRIVDDTKLRRIFHRSLAYVSPRSVGLGVLHSFAYGVPVVTQLPLSQHGPEVRNIIDGETGILYDPERTSLSSILVRLSTGDSSLRLGRTAYEYYSTCRHIDQMVAGFWEALQFVEQQQDHKYRSRSDKMSSL